MTQIIFNSSREPLALTKPWPAMPCAFKSCDCTPVGCLEMQLYRKQVEEVIASAVPFKLEEDREKITDTIATELSLNERWSYGKFMDWQPEVNKPYDVPKGLEIEFREVEYGHVDDYSKPHGFTKKAFLKQQEQVKVESQDELWREAGFSISKWAYRDEVINQLKSRFRIERI